MSSGSSPLFLNQLLQPSTAKLLQQEIGFQFGSQPGCPFLLMAIQIEFSATPSLFKLYSCKAFALSN